VYAIIHIAGVQVKASPDAVLRVPRLQAEVGNTVTFEEVLLWSDGESVEVGTPLIKGKKVEAEVLRHGKDEKVIVFKKKKRKKYRRRNGHRQQFTEIRLKAFAG